MLVTIVARVVARNFSMGIYDAILDLKGIPFFEESPPEFAKHASLRARHIMSPHPLVLMYPEVKVSALVDTLKEHSCEEFPVVDLSRGDALVGVVARAHIMVMFNHKGVFYDQDDCPRFRALV